MARGGARKGAGRKPGQKLTDEWRSRIQTGAIIARMNKLALDALEDESGQRKKIDPAIANVQVRAALGLLAKTLPDLQTMQHEGADGGPIVIITKAE